MTVLPDACFRGRQPLPDVFAFDASIRQYFRDASCDRAPAGHEADSFRRHYFRHIALSFTWPLMLSLASYGRHFRLPIASRAAEGHIDISRHITQIFFYISRRMPLSGAASDNATLNIFINIFCLRHCHATRCRC